VFSLDNVAAVFGCSSNVYLVWAATMFAVLGLRAWYTIIAVTVGDMPALQTATGFFVGGLVFGLGLST
jgi:predicted tellurium resistance membrane protein TerC